MTKQCDELKGAVERLREAADASPEWHSGYSGSGWIIVVQHDLRTILAALPQDDEVERLRGALDDIAGQAAGLSIDDGIFDIARAALHPIQSPRTSGEDQ